jgi:hypothetical protein
MEFKLGQMERNMKVSGRIIRLMARAHFGMWMEIYLRESGKTTKLMAMECIRI